MQRDARYSRSKDLHDRRENRARAKHVFASASRPKHHTYCRRRLRRRRLGVQLPLPTSQHGSQLWQDTACQLHSRAGWMHESATELQRRCWHGNNRSVWLGRSDSSDWGGHKILRRRPSGADPVKFFQPKYRLGHPENYLFLLSKNIFLGWKYPRNV